MNKEANKQLALKLLNADTEEEVIRLLTDAGYWEDEKYWRLYGDKEGNFAQAGNQQSLPEAALVEKIVNSVDARLMNECLTRSISPESSEAPQSVRDAVATYFEGRSSPQDEAGTLIRWPKTKRTEESKFITIAATGDKPTRGKRTRRMCLTIVDQGEGQSPDRFPRTILSFNARNKQRVRFVQGKFNMGGSGALRFCGENGIQLVISRRNPSLSSANKDTNPNAESWGFTVVRREEPSNKSGDPVHSEFTYLAPIGADSKPREGELLSFAAPSLPLMPQHDTAYARNIEWGTAIKLFEYETSVGQSNILMKDGLLFALERLLPEIALPVRLHECRGYKGEKERSFETPLAGLVVRLEDGRGDNLESGFPKTAKISAGGMEMSVRIFAFKEDRAATYLKDEGVIFAINGQSHGHIPKSIFSRPKAVGLPRLKDSLLVLIDCSTLMARQREDLFMSSRDRLSKKPIRYTVEREIESLLKNHPALRQLQQERRQKDVESKLSEEKPLEEVLNKVLKSSPTLNKLFLRGLRLSKPFDTTSGGGGDGKGGTDDKEKEPFVGKRHPSVFKFEKVDYGKTLKRNCELGRRVRVNFTTDVENEYFDRSTDRGFFTCEPLDTDSRPPKSENIILDNGYARWSFELPDDVKVGDKITLQTTVTDPTLSDPFVNIIEVTVKEKHTRSGGESSQRKRKGGGAGNDPGESGISLPKVILVREEDEHWKKYDFTEKTACHVISDPIEVDGKELMEHVFYINMDNAALKTDMKYSKQDARLLEAKFKYGNVLLGLALLHEFDEDQKNGSVENEGISPDAGENPENDSVQAQIRKYSEAVAPVLLPMIDELAGLDESQIGEGGELGDDD